MPHLRHKASTYPFFLFALVLSACSHNTASSGMGGLPPLASSHSPAVAGGARTRVQSVGGTIAVSGQIANIYSSSKMLVKTTQCGYENVLSSASTTLSPSNLAPKAGLYATVSGTGSCSSSINASSITLSTAPAGSVPPGSVTVSGSIASISSATRFLMHTMQCGYEYIDHGSTTTIVGNGSSIAPGVAATIVGTGSCSSSITASSITLGGASPTPNPTVPKHIATWVMDEYWAQGENASSAQVRQYVTYAEGGLGNGKAANDCSSSGACFSVFYLNPNEISDSVNCPISGDSQFVTAASESWYVHETGYSDSAHRVHGEQSQSCHGSTITIPVYVANQASSAVQSFFRSYLQKNADGWNYYFMDHTAWDVVDQMYGPGGGFCPGSYNNWCTSTQEVPTASALVSAHGSFATAMVHTNGQPMRFFTNGLDPTPSAELAASSHFVGGVCENCVVDGGVFRPAMYATVLTDMALVDDTPNAAFVELNDGASPSGSAAQIAQRIVTVAVAWLGYSEGHTIVNANLEDNTNNLAVWPEDAIVPASPVESMSTSASNIAVGSNVWRREFSSCYEDGTAVGPCAAILNGTGSTVTISSSWLRQSYGHVVTLSGGDVTSGGSVSLTAVAFKANSTTIPPDQAILLVR